MFCDLHTTVRPTGRDCTPFVGQVIHGTSTLGMPKVDSARDRMLDVNPHVEVETFHEQLTSENALRILDGYDVVSRLSPGAFEAKEKETGKERTRKRKPKGQREKTKERKREREKAVSYTHLTLPTIYSV